jgi:hypothetical protein
MDHIARAESLRQRATACESMANESTSAEIKNCYLLLAKHYVALVQLEADSAAGNARLAGLGEDN